MLSPRLNKILDQALEEENGKEEPRRYLGGSRVGVECDRALQFEFFATPKDPEKNFSGRLLRIFARGHWVEAAMVGWMKMAGIEIKDTDDDGKQFGFSEHDGLFRGHCDGIITGGPEEFGPFPRLWENKGLKDSSWKALVRDGLKKDKPVYYAQCQVYMDRFGLAENPALFSAVNADTMEIHWESVVFNPGALVQYDAKAGRVLQSCLAGELLPRISQDPSFYKCKWCSWVKRCFNQKD